VPLLARTPLDADHLHTFDSTVTPGTAATHIRVSIFPDGGVSRLRIFGTPTRAGRQRAMLQFLNALSDAEVRVTLADYCAAPEWISRMAAARPYQRADAVLSAADAALDALGRDDWVEAFRHHPRIGERTAERPQSVDAIAASAREQSGVSTAVKSERDALAEANGDYERRFGHVFIICAAGKTAPEILSALRSRLANDPDTELRVAADELRCIARLRLERHFG
jgi:allantoicase